MKKNGFISTTLIYTFFIIFLSMMVFLLSSYSKDRNLLSEFKNDIKNSFAEASRADLNLYIYVWNAQTEEFEMRESVPSQGYFFEPAYSYCQKGSTISYNNGNLSINATQKDSCYAYFRAGEKDIILKIYTKESATSKKTLVEDIPDDSYDLSNISCSKGNIKFDEKIRKVILNASEKTECEIEFTKRDTNVTIHMYKEDKMGTIDYNGLSYTAINEVPLNYEKYTYVCTNEAAATDINIKNNKLIIHSKNDDECNVYFTGSNGAEIIIMQETAEGTSGYTTGKKYSRTYGVPGYGYKFVGSICNPSDLKIEFVNGSLALNGTSAKYGTCYAYFEKYNGDVFIFYHLQKNDGSYELVSVPPEIGYNYVTGYCQNGSKITMAENIPFIEAKGEDECHIYYDIVNPDIYVKVYVMNRETGKYELGNVPMGDYEFYNAGCTNGAQIEFNNGALKVISEGPTTCTVYFR